MLGIGSALRNKLFALEGAAFARSFMRANALRWRLPVDLKYLPDLDGYAVEDAGASNPTRIVFARKERIWVYAKGVESRLDRLAQIYGLASCPLVPGDMVIDCGANVGEFSAIVTRRHGCRVIAVEPEASEARCIQHNAPGVIEVVNAALWKEPGELKFYSKNRSADSSLFETRDYDHVTTVKAVTLDDLLARHGVQRLKLLKLEAEGAEPEILLGARESLQRIEYITADLGPERGLSEESTAPPVCNLLFEAGFEIVSLYPKRLVFVFRNRRFAGAAG